MTSLGLPKGSVSLILKLRIGLGKFWDVLNEWSEEVTQGTVTEEQVRLLEGEMRNEYVGLS